MTAFVLQIAGALLAILFLVILRFLHLPRRRTLAAALFLAALIYVAFAVQQNAAIGWLGVELLGVLGFGLFGWLGLRSSQLWLAAGWALHAFWDIGLHLLGPARGIAPHWYAHLCLSFDLVVAGYIAVKTLSARRVFPH